MDDEMARRHWQRTDSPLVAEGFLARGFLKHKHVPRAGTCVLGFAPLATGEPSAPPKFLMAMTMVAPMGLIMLFVMRGMFPNKRLNVGLMVGFVALFIVALWMGRAETLVGDDQFLRAMIPHHSRAILVCEEASITDPEIQELCGQIISSQQEEIDIMQNMLEER